MHYIDTDHENPAVQALIDAAIAVDEQLPGAWSRIAEYLETYKDKTGVLGRRKLDGDGNTAELRAEDLHTLIGALETILDAHTGPDESAFEVLECEQDGVGLADLDAKLDEILKHVAPGKNPGQFFYFDEDGNRVEGQKPIAAATIPPAPGGIVMNIEPGPSTSTANDYAIGYSAGLRAGRSGR